MKTIINLTQHRATSEQIAEGVIDLPEVLSSRVRELLTFDILPEKTALKERANNIVKLLDMYITEEAMRTERPLPKKVYVMLGGAPYLMRYLENALNGFWYYDIIPLYAFTERVSYEETQPDGTVKKVSSFKHAGFVEV
ncbi:hypothetical protein V757_00365 [Pelistega indica]|uniref:Uncharacterized protein n=1 Tax=Pelistega indica TaxID=1414851 RepID=V8G989_9BURK|nr:hypothetical protein [Pelistega indica]ETD73094.1 hypothetical protein V757_00365 [Pelistega indica]